MTEQPRDDAVPEGNTDRVGGPGLNANAALTVTSIDGPGATVTSGTSVYRYQYVTLAHTCGKQTPLRVGDVLYILGGTPGIVRVREPGCACVHLLYGERS